jgi:hypothetical protein
MKGVNGKKCKSNCAVDSAVNPEMYYYLTSE